MSEIWRSSWRRKHCKKAGSRRDAGLTRMRTVRRQPPLAAGSESTPRLGPPPLAGGPALGIPPRSRGVVLSEQSESKGDGSGAPGLFGGFHEQLRPFVVPRGGRDDHALPDRCDERRRLFERGPDGG